MKIDNVSEPNLLETAYPDELHRIKFDDEPVPREKPSRIWITDTTFRDGQQARPPYTIDQITKLFGLLARLDNGTGVIRESEFFLYSDSDKKAVEACRDKGYEFPKVTGWIRANIDDFKLVKDIGLKETGILTSASDYQIFLKMELNRKMAAEKYLRVVDAALDEGIRPRCHLEDITRADIHGFVIPFVQQLMKRSEQVPDELKIKIRACDTMGYGVADTYASLPRGVPKLIHSLVHEAGVPPERLEWHGHNDFHKAAPNAFAAWNYGACAVNCTLLGIGERTGNTALEGMIMDYISLRGNPGINTRVITEIGEYCREIGIDIPINFPLIGRDFNTTRAGIHVAGLLKDERIYSALPSQLLNRPPVFAITDRSGAAGISAWIKEHTGHLLEKSDPGLLNVVGWVNDQYNNGNARTTAISHEEMSGVVGRYISIS